jgi:hypothetical protein
MVLDVGREFFGMVYRDGGLLGQMFCLDVKASDHLEVV